MKIVRWGLAVSALIFGAGAAGAAYFYPFITPEMIEHAQREHEEKVAALTPEQRAWLSLEADWKQGESRRQEEARHRMKNEIDALLEEDIRAYGEPAGG